MEKHFDFKNSESKLYDYWLKNNLFSSLKDDKKPVYCTLLAPPNLSGTLHLGHALNCTIQDILVRYHKLKGYNVLWQVGTDHGGISTQNAFEKELAKNKITRQQLGREKCVEEMHKWVNTKHDIIISQLKRLGLAFDWSREQYTLNDHFSKLVIETFIKLYNDKLIYRGNYIVNWCPRCATSLADDEVEEQENNGKMYYIRYKFVNDTKKYITIATTRPETMFGDTAIAFNPTDERYIGLENQEVYIPIINKKIKLITDDVIHKDFGTGLVKITPAHNRIDFNIGKTHNLDTVKIINEKCKMFNTNTKYDGLDRFKCREELVKELQELNFIDKIENHKNKQGVCYRCQTIIEPNLSNQWFVKMESLIELAQKAINGGKIELIPDYQTKIFNVWTNKNMDWCISRSIYWGHQIPIWYCSLCSEIICCEKNPMTCPKCNSDKLERETDVLDTWFSSALWGHGIFENKEDFDYYYPTNVLVTGKDILYFWVSRMIMMSLYMTGKIPFERVLLHGIVRDEHGNKMSKSKGNGIDPLKIIDEYGTDALRYTLMYNMSLGNDINISIKSFDLGKVFCTKLWNASRYILMSVTNVTVDPDDITINNDFDKWLLYKIKTINDEISQLISKYDFSSALAILGNFFWNDFCNMYLEIAKNYINDINTKKALLIIISKILIMYHPFVPFITEELWSKLRSSFTNLSESIMHAKLLCFDNIDTFKLMETQYFIDMIYKIRTKKGNSNYKKILIMNNNNDNVEFMNANKGAFAKLIKIDNVSIIHNPENEMVFTDQ